MRRITAQLRGRGEAPEEEAAGLVPEELARVHRLTVNLDLVVQVRAGGAAGVPGERDDLSPVDALARLHADLLEVPVERAQLVAVIEDDGVAVLAAAAREVHGAGGRGQDRGPPIRADVEAAVELLLAGPRGLAHAEPRVERPAHRPAQRQRQEHRAGALHEAPERAQALPALAHAARQERQRLRQGRRLVGEDEREHRHRTAHARPLDAASWSRPERAPHPQVRGLPPSDLAVEIGHSLLDRVEHHPLLLHPALDAGRLDLSPLQREVIPPGPGEEGHERGHREEHPPEEPAWATHVEHAAAAAVHQDQGEAPARHWLMSA